MFCQTPANAPILIGAAALWSWIGTPACGDPGGDGSSGRDTLPTDGDSNGTGGTTSGGSAGSGTGVDTGPRGTSSGPTGETVGETGADTGPDPSGGSAGTGGDGDSGDTGGSTPIDGIIVAYYTAWSTYDRAYQVADIPADRISHINYAFANVSTDGECVLGDPYADVDKAFEGDTWDPGALRGNFNQLRRLKTAHPHLRTLISVGGWTWSGNFSPAAASAAGRERLARSCVAFMREYGFDGLDIDWEYPVGGGLEGNDTSPDDRRNYTLLLQEIRRQLDQAESEDDATYLLTIAAPAGPSIMENLELGTIHEPLDWINLMAYDFHGSWSERTNFNAPLFAPSDDPTPNAAALSVDAAVRGYLDAGTPASKLVLGVPFYGRGWTGALDTSDGLYSTHTGAAPGTWEAGVLDYDDIVANYLPSTFSRHWDDEAQVPWLHDSTSGVMITYDDVESMERKARYVADRDLRGAMYWELSGDRHADLLSALGRWITIR